MGKTPSEKYRNLINRRERYISLPHWTSTAFPSFLPSEKLFAFLFLRMEREEKDLIRRYSHKLVDDVIPVDMLPYLPCLTQSDKEKIRCEETNNGAMRATQELMDRLFRRRNAFREFITALWETGCGHLAEEICPQEENGKLKSIIREISTLKNQTFLCSVVLNSCVAVYRSYQCSLLKTKL